MINSCLKEKYSFSSGGYILFSEHFKGNISRKTKKKQQNIKLSLHSVHI